MVIQISKWAESHVGNGNRVFTHIPKQEVNWLITEVSKRNVSTSLFDPQGLVRFLKIFKTFSVTQKYSEFEN